MDSKPEYLFGQRLEKLWLALPVLRSWEAWGARSLGLPPQAGQRPPLQGGVPGSSGSFRKIEEQQQRWCKRVAVTRGSRIVLAIYVMEWQARKNCRPSNSAAGRHLRRSYDTAHCLDEHSEVV